MKKNLTIIKVTLTSLTHIYRVMFVLCIRGGPSKGGVQSQSTKLVTSRMPQISGLSKKTVNATLHPFSLKFRALQLTLTL